MKPTKAEVLRLTDKLREAYENNELMWWDFSSMSCWILDHFDPKPVRVVAPNIDMYRIPKGTAKLIRKPAKKGKHNAK